MPQSFDDERSLEAFVAQQLSRLRTDAGERFAQSGTRAIHQTVFEAGGKLLRPRLLLLTAAFGQPDWEVARRAACAVELLHVREDVLHP